MKKLLFLLTIGLISFTTNAQPPMAPQRHLPNQFRDFVDHQQRLQVERPTIEKKDGKVIITMSEEQFKRMNQMRQAQKMRMANWRPQPPCQRCQKFGKKQHRRKI